MSNKNQSISDQRRLIGEKLDREVDPLEQYNEVFFELEAKGVRPFEMFLNETIRDGSLA